jgi:hypothetical protein
MNDQVPLSSGRGVQVLPPVLRVETVELLHGTSSANWELIQQSGNLGRPCPARATASKLAGEFGLDPDLVLASTSFEFSLIRNGDPKLYLTCDPRVARRHAEICSEVLDDALTACFRALHPRTNHYRQPGLARLERFKADYRTKHGLEPVIVRLRIPLRDELLPEGSKIRDVREWWRSVNRGGPLNTLTFGEPLPASGCTAELLAAA